MMCAVSATKEVSFDKSSDCAKDLLNRKSVNMLLLYHLVYELHWRPREVFAMEPWELGLIWALAEYHQKQINKT